MEYPNFSVLMSLYIKEKAEYFDKCMQSMLSQTVMPTEIVIVFDGPVSDELRSVVEKYKEQKPGWINTIENKRNKGLGLALADGVPACKYELIARMDTDDIAFCQLTSKDVVRHPLVQQIVQASEEYEARQARQSGSSGRKREHRR